VNLRNNQKMSYDNGVLEMVAVKFVHYCYYSSN
jgi:hypothetical protein